MAKKQSETERLKKKKEYEQKRRDAIKSDPVAKVEQREKERLRYVAKKSRGIIKPIKDLKKREQRAKRKQWRINTNNSRKRKSFADELLRNTPPSSINDTDDPFDDSIAAEPTPESTSKPPSSETTPKTSRKTSGRKNVRRDRSKLHRRNVKLLEEITRLKRSAAKYKKRAQRATQSTSKQDSPHIRVHKMLRHCKVTTKVRRSLLKGEVVEDQLVENFSTLKDENSKQMFARFCSGSFLKKYKLLGQCRFLHYKQFWSSQKKQGFALKRRLRLHEQILKRRQDVANFLQEDENSRMCPGKKECITRRKVKKQKRTLSDSLRVLHKTFLLKNTGYEITYATFCKYRPFWVVQPNVNDRETCKCSSCANMEFLVDKLYKLQVIKENSISKLLSEVCCHKDNESCLLKKCMSCLEKPVLYLQFEPEKDTSYKCWKTVQEKYTDKDGQERITSKVKLVEVLCTLNDLVTKLNDSLNKYMNHIANKNHQFLVLRNLKTQLKDNEVVIHVDFSENYSCKYGTEIQALHFGGSRQQITLHTGIFYYHGNDMTNLQSFCTVSESLRHDPPAIWAHLDPILVHIMSELPLIDTVHFVSDSPATQYRNKMMFHIISQCFIEDFPNLKTISWNYSEAGHGKAAPDGIGGVLKRTADKHVAKGKDCAKYNDFLTLITNSCPSVMIISIPLDKIDARDKQIQSFKADIHTFPGTMKVHQMSWQQATSSIDFRSLSCFECAAGSACDHYSLGQRIVLLKALESQEQARPRTPTDGLQLDVNPIDINMEGIKIGHWVVVLYEHTLYPGEVIALDEQMLTVQAMAYSGANKFKWPLKPDICTYVRSNVKRIINAPIPCNNRSRCSEFYFTDFP